MAEYTYEQLKGMTVAQLREIAQGITHDALEGFSVWHKDHLLPVLCKVLSIPTHHIAAGEEKARIKAAIKKLKTRRAECAKAGDEAQMAAVRHQLHLLKHRLRNMAEQAA